MVHRLPARRVVVDPHVGIGRRLPTRSHDLDAHQFEPAPLGLLHREGHDDHGVDLAPGRQPFEEVVPVVQVTDRIEQDVELGRPQLGEDPLGDGAEEPAGQVWHHHGDPPRPAAGQAGGVR